METLNGSDQYLYNGNHNCTFVTQPATSCNNDVVTDGTTCNRVPITTYIQNALNNGYDGVFFDEAPTDNDNYLSDCGALVKAGSNKLVIVNPGKASGVDSNIYQNDNVDIVSIETATPSGLAAVQPAAWRWMALSQGTDENTAKSTLSSDRSAGAFWYYPGPYTTLPSYLADWASYVSGLGAGCTGGSGSGYQVTVNSTDLDNGNAALNGLCIYVDGSSGCTAFTPATLSLSSSSHNITVGNYQMDIFSIWSDGTTSATHAVTAAGALTARYHDNGNITLSVVTETNAGATITGMYNQLYNAGGTAIGSGYSRNQYALTPNTAYSLSAADYQQHVFSHWSTGATTRQISVDSGSNVPLIAYYTQ
jgi:hypothetical protein